MSELIEVFCPYCGEVGEIDLEEQDLGEIVEDCQVCCRPMKLTIVRDEYGDAEVEVERMD